MADQTGAPPAPPVATDKVRNVLTDDMPEPPAITERKRRVARKRREGPFVKYVGGASQRDITPADWGTLQIELKDKNATHSWNLQNDYMVESANFSDEQLDYLLIDDVIPTGGHSFVEVDWGTGENEGKLVQVVDE